jgi:Na+-driven multidrug efflux pump
MRQRSCLCLSGSALSWGHMDLVKDPIPRLIRQIAVPASVGFFFNTMYNVVDTFFAGLDSTDALAALAVSFPDLFHHHRARRRHRAGHPPR